MSATADADGAPDRPDRTADRPQGTDDRPRGEADRRLLLVHAHPDDETIGTGATMARYVAEGAHVALVTCTLGEEGEILTPEFAELAADRGDQLGGYRIAELAAACAALGVADHRFLGGPGRYRDSGMMGVPSNDHPRCFWRVDLDTAAGQLAEVVREVRPQVVVTYDSNGFYGHPDHIQTHRATMRALELAADPAWPGDGRGPWRARKVYWTAQPRSLLAEGIAWFVGTAENPFGDARTVDDLPFGTPDEEITARIDASAYAHEKLEALRAHATQIAPDSWLFTLASNFGADEVGVEHYVLAAGDRGPGEGRFGWETDLFAGLD